MCTWVVLPFYYVISKFYIVHKVGWTPTNRSPSQFFTAMGFCYSHLFSYPDFIFYPLQESTESRRPESSTNSRGTLSKHRKGGFFILFLSLGMWFRIFSLFENFKNTLITFNFLFYFFHLGFSLWVCVVWYIGFF